MYPANTMLGPDGAPRVPDRQHFIATQRAVIDRLARDELI
jgi:hypothetical protein